MPLFARGNLTMEYEQHGSGPATSLCFHGFGRNVRDFDILLPHLASGHRVIFIHLFFHGLSEFPLARIERQPLTHHEWKLFLEAFLEELDVPVFDLVGYSLGGRVAMESALALPDRTRSVLLLAPDGLKINPLYRFASGTGLGRWLYRRLIDNPTPLFLLASFLNRLGILEPKLYRFVHVHLDTREKRMQVHDTWLAYRKMFPDLDALASLVLEKRFEFHMIFGKYDSVIKPALGEKLSRIIGDDQSLHILETGHRLLTEQTMNYIVAHGLWRGATSVDPM